MKNIPVEITEGLASDISGQLLYSFFVDLFPITSRKGGLLTIMFPNVGVKKMSRWLGNITETETYSQNLDLIKSISQKFGANSTLKSLYRVVNSLKSKETKPEDNDARISDITLVMSKIQRIIKSKLTPEEQKLFNSLSSELREAAENASKSIEGSVGASTTQAEKPEEKPEETPEETPATSKKGGEEEESPKKQESITKEEFERQLKSLIKEIVKEKLGL
jgi:hypothetical protein